jgi:DNA-binding NarL/FixJ family response regulator
MTVRVVLGEDSFVVREGINRIVEQIEDVEIVASCVDAPTLLSAIDQELPDVVLTDIRMPPSKTDEGIRVAAKLRTTHPEIGVVVLSQYAEPAYAVELFRAGSDRRAYLLKERLKDRSELSRAIKAVAAGSSVVDPRVIDKLIEGRARLADSKLAALTARELEILGLVAEGQSNAAIGEALVISKRAVEHHINAIFYKLGLTEAADISRRVVATVMYLTEQPD